MRYTYVGSNAPVKPIYGETYETIGHPVYRFCTLYRVGNKGLAIVQQRHDSKTKSTSWSAIDPELTGELYLHPKFKEYFDKMAGIPVDGIYPTVTIRQAMWALRIKPLPRQPWETYFDRKFV